MKMKNFTKVFIFFIMASSIYCYEMNADRERRLKGEICKKDKYEHCGLSKNVEGLPLFPPNGNLPKVRGYMWEKHCSSMTKITSCLIQYAEQCETFFEAAYARMMCELCSDKSLYRKIQNNIFCLYTDYYRTLFDGRMACKTTQEKIVEFLYKFAKKKDEYFPEMPDQHFWGLLDGLGVMHMLGCYLSHLSCEDKAAEEEIVLEGSIILFAPVKRLMEYYRIEVGKIMKSMTKKWQKHINDGWTKFEKKCSDVQCSEYKQQSTSCWNPEWFYPNV